MNIVNIKERKISLGGSLGHSHLVWSFSPPVGIFTSCGHFSPCVAILTSHRHFHLTWPFLTMCGHSHPNGPHLVHSPPQYQMSSCMFPNMREQTSHLLYILHASLHAKIVFFTSRVKNSPKNHKATPIPSIRYLYKPPNKYYQCS